MLRIPAIAQQILTQTAATAAATIQPFILSPSDFDGVTFELNVTAVTGTSPTLDLFIQTQDTDGNWRDCVHFTQITASSASRYYASLTPGSSDRYIGAITTTSISAATLGVGLLTNNLRAVANLGGTSPAFTYTLRAYLSAQSGRT
jgi:hypothetical protein